MRVVEYGPGGFDPSKPKDNVVGELEVPDPPNERRDRIRALRSRSAKATTVPALREALDEVLAMLEAEA